ncbi:hypothetical protein BGZ76_011857 [Entomortierella beljakovae]|nr:hypothetical protein BGZ76_011857 [Entomortierella beljakovae]
MPEKKSVIHDNIHYRIRISAGQDIKSLKPICANDDANPLLIDSDEFSGHLVFRVKEQDQINGYEQGQKQDNLPIVTDSPWFKNASADGKGNNILMSMHVVGRFKREWPGDQPVISVMFKERLKLPPFTNVALKFFRAIDPGLQVDVQCPNPYFQSPLLCGMNTVNVYKNPSIASSSCKSIKEEELTVPLWTSYNGESAKEDTSMIVCEEDAKKKAKISNDCAARKSYFAKPKNLSSHRYLKDQIYEFELFNPFLDCSQLAVKIPGLFMFHLYKLLNEQPITYVFKTRDDSATFLAVAMELVPVVEDQSDI